jgi:hypothetical protein
MDKINIFLWYNKKDYKEKVGSEKGGEWFNFLFCLKGAPVWIYLLRIPFARPNIYKINRFPYQNVKKPNFLLPYRPRKCVQKHEVVFMVLIIKNK